MKKWWIVLGIMAVLVVGIIIAIWYRYYCCSRDHISFCDRSCETGMDCKKAGCSCININESFGTSEVSGASPCFEYWCACIDNECQKLSTIEVWDFFKTRALSCIIDNESYKLQVVLEDSNFESISGPDGVASLGFAFIGNETILREAPILIESPFSYDFVVPISDVGNLKEVRIHQKLFKREGDYVWLEYSDKEDAYCS